jgi:hypothetical protein
MYSLYILIQQFDAWTRAQELHKTQQLPQTTKANGRVYCMKLLINL